MDSITEIAINNILIYTDEDDGYKLKLYALKPLEPIVVSVIVYKCSATSINKIEFNKNSQLVGIYDLSGRQANQNQLNANCIYIYKYDNGFCEKKMILK
jgi:hypothetical protein